MRPDLATVVAGMNDLIRRDFDAAMVAACIEEMFAALTDTGARVQTVPFPDIGRIAPLARPLRPRVLDLNARIRTAAARYGVGVVETFRHQVTTDARLWSPDRLHASPLGHALIAAAFAHALGLPGTDESWTHPLPPLAPRTPAGTVAAEARWLASFASPWIYRRLRGRSSGDGRVAKRPGPEPCIASETQS